MDHKCVKKAVLEVNSFSDYFLFYADINYFNLGLEKRERMD